MAAIRMKNAHKHTWMRTIRQLLSRVGLIVVACWASSSVASRYGQAMCRRDVIGTLVPAESHYRLCCKRCCHRYTSRPAVCIPVSQSPTVSLRRNVDCEHNDQVARWVDKWRNGNREEQEQAIEWVSRQYITAGMQRRDAELFLGPGIRGESHGILYVYLPHDGRSQHALWVYYRMVNGTEVVGSFDLTTGR